MKRIIVILFWGVMIGNISVSAQIEKLFSARDDAQKYLNYYMAPAVNGLMYNLNNSWYTTGKTHKKWGFDFTVNASVSMIPEDEKSFLFKSTEYNHLSISSGSATLPTVASGTTTTQLTATNNAENSISMNAVNGVGDQWPINFFIPVSIPTPMIQVGLGIPSGTDVKLHYVPKITQDELSFNLIGVGLQHDLTQHLKALDKIPTLHVSALGAFTNSYIVYTPKNSSVAGENQTIEMSVNTYTIQAIGDIDLKIINFYLGLGYTGGITNLEALGTYKYDFDNNGSYSSDEIIIDPMLLKFDIFGMKTTAGVRFNLGPIKVFADYTLQKYASITAGLALSIR